MSALARIAQRSAAEREAALARCELCATPIGDNHRHLLEPEQRDLLCACRACALLFDRGGRYLLVPEGRRRLDGTGAADGFELDDLTWESLRLPVDIAFVLRAADGRLQAFYPGPMGATESHLGLQELPLALEPEVEALLVNRAQGRREHWLVPIDDCFRLVGLIRMNWRGLTGGKVVWQKIATFFDSLEERS
jgi:hypothetical protein